MYDLPHALAAPNGLSADQALNELRNMGRNYTMQQLLQVGWVASYGNARGGWYLLPSICVVHCIKRLFVGFHLTSIWEFVQELYVYSHRVAVDSWVITDLYVVLPLTSQTCELLAAEGLLYNTVNDTSYKSTGA